MMHDQTGDTIDALVTYAATCEPGDIPAPVRAHTIDLLLDTLGCILAGSTAEGIADARRVALFFGGAPQATVLGYGDRTNAVEAAFLNSAMGHARDYDDTHDPAVNHGCVTLVPALLATAEAAAHDQLHPAASRLCVNHVSGRDFLTALAIGLDVVNRLGLAFIPYLHTGWLPTTLWGPLACAAACGRLLALEPSRMHHAFGLAYAQIHGNRQALIDGTLAKRFQPGFSAAAGVRAAFLAAVGITGPRRILDGDYGIAALYTSGQMDSEAITDGLGETFETLNVSIKPYPSCRCTHPVIDAILELRQTEGVSAQDVREGLIRLPPNSMGQIGKPFAVRDNPTVDAQFSAQYTAALALVHGRPGLSSFAPGNVRTDTAVLDVAQRFRAVEFEQGNPGLVPVEVELQLTDGRQCGLRLPLIKGSPAKPLSREELESKFSDCLDHAVKEYPSEQRAAILAAVRGVDTLDDAAELVQML